MMADDVRYVEPALFIYGTLHPDRAPREIRATVARLRLVGPATVTGQLLDLGDYPGLITNGEQNTVPGHLFALPDDPAVLEALDAYEGYDAGDVEHSLFRREHMLVTLGNGAQQRHWIYLYNQLT